MTELIYIRGEGGAVWKMAEPLPTPIQQRLDRGEISRVHPDGSPWRERKAAPEPAPAPVVEDQGEGDEPHVPGRPAQAAPKSEWIDYAARRGLVSRDDAAAYTKLDLIEMTS